MANATVWISTTAAILGATFGVISFLWTYRDRRRWTISHMLEVLAPLIRSHTAVPKIEVRYNDRPVTDPHVARLSVTVRAPKAITRDRFEDDKPIVFELDCEVVEILSLKSLPSSPAMPPMKISGERHLEFGPALLHRRHQFVIEILTAGQPKRVTTQDHLIDVDMVERSSPVSDNSMLKKIVTWGSIAFLVFFIAFRPQAATGAFRAVGDFFSALIAGN